MRADVGLDISEGHDHALHRAEEAEHGSDRGDGGEDREVFFKGCDDINAVVFHALDDLLFHLGLIVVKAAEDEVFAKSAGKDGGDGAAGGVAELERFLDFVFGEEVDDFFAEFAGVGFEELEATIAFDDDRDGEDEEREEGPHEEAAFEEKFERAGLEEAGGESGVGLVHRLFVEICFFFKLGQELGKSKAATGVFGGIAFGEVPAAAVVAAEGVGNVLAHAVAFAGPE